MRLPIQKNIILTKIGKKKEEDLKVNKDSVPEVPIEEKEIDPVVRRSVRIIKPPNRLNL